MDTRAGGTPDLIDNGINDFLCEVNNSSDLPEKLNPMLSSKDEGHAYGLNTRKSSGKICLGNRNKTNYKGL